MMEIFLSAAIFFLTLFALVTLLNTFTFPRIHLKPPHASGECPMVSVLIPMRNEEGIIASSIASLQKQDYPHFEVILLDDNSTDACAKIAGEMIKNDPRFALKSGSELPAGWTGKNWACHQLYLAASGSILLFTDADVNWHPLALSQIISQMQITQADLLTVWPWQKTVSWSERLVVPLMHFAIFAYLPALAVHHIPWRVFTAAIGQCLVFTRKAYQTTGGHAAVRGQITDDMALGSLVKKSGMRLRMAEGSEILSCRMYTNWSEVRKGYGKNILAGHANNLAFLIFSTFFHWWLFVLPWFWLAGALIQGTDPVPPLLCILTGVLIRAVSAARSRQRIVDAAFMPISVVLMTIIAIQGVLWRLQGGPQWKDRRLFIPPP